MGYTIEMIRIDSEKPTELVAIDPNDGTIYKVLAGE